MNSKLESFLHQREELTEGNISLILQKIIGKSPKFKRIYLGGAVESAKDLGSGWRKQLKEFLNSNKIDVVNPNEIESISDANFLQNRNNKQKPEYITRIRQVISSDIHQLKRCDALVIYFDKNMIKRSSGTHGEATLAYVEYNIPVMLILVDTTINDIHGWLLGCTSKIFNNIEEFKEYIKS